MGFIKFERKKVVLIDPPTDGLLLRIANLQYLAFTVNLFDLLNDNFTEVYLFISGNQSIFNSFAPASLLQFFHRVCIGQEKRQVKLILICSFRSKLKDKVGLAFSIYT